MPLPGDKHPTLIAGPLQGGPSLPQVDPLLAGRTLLPVVSVCALHLIICWLSFALTPGGFG